MCRQLEAAHHISPLRHSMLDAQQVTLLYTQPVPLSKHLATW